MLEDIYGMAVGMMFIVTGVVLLSAADRAAILAQAQALLDDKKPVPNLTVVRAKLLPGGALKLGEQVEMRVVEFQNPHQQFFHQGDV